MAFMEPSLRKDGAQAEEEKENQETPDSKTKPETRPKSDLDSLWKQIEDLSKPPGGGDLFGRNPQYGLTLPRPDPLPERLKTAKLSQSGIEPDRTTRALLERVNLARDCDRAAKAAKVVFASLAESPQSKLSFEFVQAYLNLDPDNRELQAAGLKLLAARPDVKVPKAFISKALEAQPAEVHAAGLDLAASRKDYSIDKESIDRRLSEAAAQTGDHAAMLDEIQRQFASGKFDESLLTSRGEKSPAVAAAALRLLASRPDVALPEGIRQQMTDILNAFNATPKHSETSPFAAAIDPEGFAAKQELRRAVIGLVTSRNIPGAVDFLRENFPQERFGSGEGLAAIAASKEMRGAYAIDQLIADHRKWNEMRQRPGAQSLNNDRAQADLLLKMLSERGKTSLAPGQLSEIKMPLLNALRNLSGQNPSGWKALTAAGDRAVSAFALRVAETIYSERTALLESKRDLFAPGKPLLAVLHEESEFPLGPIDELIARYDMRKVDAIKGSTDSAVTEVRKEKALQLIGSMAADSKTESTVYFSAHGGPKHIWLSHGQAGSEESAELNTPNGISYVELAKTLVDSQAGKPVLDLSHVSLVLDACRQHEFAENLRSEIQELSKGRELKGLPLIVSASQNRQYGYGSGRLEGSLLETALNIVVPDSAKKFSMADLFALDKKMAARVDDSQRLGINLNGSVVEEDLGIFSPQVRAGENLFYEVIDDMKRAGDAVEIAEDARRRDLEPPQSSNKRALDALWRGDPLKELQLPFGDWRKKYYVPPAEEARPPTSKSLEVGAVESADSPRSKYS